MLQAMVKITRRTKTEDAILTTGDIRRIQLEIAQDTKLREEASERISRNKALLEAHDRAVSGRGRAAPKTARRITVRKAAPEKPTFVYAPKDTAHLSTLEVRPVEERKTATAKLPRGGGSYSVVMDILQRVKDGIPAPELRKQASQHPEASDSLKNHPSYIYSILDALQGRGEVVKGEDGKWRPTNAGSTATH